MQDWSKEFGLPARRAAWYEQEAEPEQEPEQEEFDSSALHMAILMHNQASARSPYIPRYSSIHQCHIGGCHLELVGFIQHLIPHNIVHF